MHLNAGLLARNEDTLPRIDVLVTAAGTVFVNDRIDASGNVTAGAIRNSSSRTAWPRAAASSTAAADLTADGTFRCAGTPDGCIALSAGGTLATSGAAFDVTPVTDCPGSPSGAFLEAPDLL